MKRNHEFPKDLFVRIERDGDDAYFLAETTVQDCLSPIERGTIARYELVEQLDAKIIVEVTKVRAAK